MAIVIGLAVGLILAGLLIIVLSGKAPYPLLVAVCFWVGVLLLIVGLVLLLTPVIVWLNATLRSMMGI